MRDLTGGIPLIINKLQQTNIWVIGLPIYNGNVPAAFKAWIDQVVRSKVTFQYTEKGPTGLIKNTKAYVIRYIRGEPDWVSNIDAISAYLQNISSFIGIKNITIIDFRGLGKNEKNVLSHAEKMIKVF